MKLKKRSTRLWLEQLESRETPSISTTYASGNLTVREGSTNTAAQKIAVVATASNAASVAINGTNIGTFANLSSINLYLNGGGADSITLTTTGQTLASSVTVSEGSGAADVFTAVGGTVTGRLSVVQGAGAGDTMSIGGSFLSSVSLNGNAGPGTAITLAAGASLAGGATISNASVTLAATAAIPGNLSINNLSLGANATLAFGGNAIGGNVDYSGGAGTNTLTTAGTNSIGGSLSFTGGYNTNSVSLNATTTVGSTVSFSGQGADTFVLAGKVGTNVTLTFGNSPTNVYTFTAGFAIGSNLSITAGNGGNSLTLTGGTIGGNVNVTFGNATNAFTIDTAAVINGAQVNYTGGTFGDTVTIGDAANLTGGYALNIKMGGTGAGGTDTVVLTNVLSLGSLSISEPTASTTSFTPPTDPYTYPVTFTNWP